MKNLIKSILVTSVIAVAFLIATPVQADPPGMPGDHGGDGDAPPGGGAPIASGVGILIAFGGAYAGKKVYQHKA